jgi:transcriptional regulator with XRE-family HTH domain
MILSEKIKTLRKRQELSQGHVAHELGLSRPTYVQIEKGEREPALSEIKKLADIFGVLQEELLSAQEPQASYDVVLERETKTKQESKPDMRISVPQKRIAIFKEVLLYLLEKVGAKPNVGETVLYKLLYFIDFDFYEKYEEQLIGATYIKNHHGPTPVEFKKIVDQMIEEGEIEQVRSSYFQYPQRKYLPHREPDLNKLTGQALKHIDEVIARYSDMNAADLSDYSHQDVPWITAKNGEALDYEAVFYRTSKTSIRSYDEDHV